MTATTKEAPFYVSVSEAQIQQLKQRLELARLPDELNKAEWNYGVPLADIKRLVDHWKTGYDWRRHEAEINDRLPQYTRDIDVDGHGTLNIHFVHRKSDNDNAIPLLFVHGWPGSFYESFKVTPLLTDATQEGPHFHVVAISLPGYGFSEGPKTKGFSSMQYAEVGHKLMQSLGYDEYVTQGGDWGYFITYAMALRYGGKNVKAWHTNMPYTQAPAFLSHPITYLQDKIMPYSAREKAGLARRQWFWQKGNSYQLVHATRPQTIGYSLADSPVGLLAWIYEKLHDWTDSYQWTDDEILTWISLYYFSRAGPAASVRIYYEVVNAGEMFQKPTKTSAPLGLSYFPKELSLAPKRWMTQVGNIAFSNEHDSGGHFAAYEKPEMLVSDVKKMYAKGSSTFGVVTNMTGCVKDPE